MINVRLHQPDRPHGGRTLLGRALWIGRRLRSMSVREVAYRAEEQRRRFVDRYWRFDAGDLLPLAADDADSEVHLPVWPGLAEALLADAAIRNSSILDPWRRTAHIVQHGAYAFLGRVWPAVGGGAASPPWHLDPVTGSDWPAGTYCFAIPYRRNSKYGDIKLVWELNRLQHLQPIAALASVTGDAALGRLCLDHIESWIDANPPFFGVNWCSGIELALRVISIVVVLSLIGRGLVDGALERKIVRSLLAHGHWLARYPSCHSSANNHLIAEAAGLFILGHLLPLAGPAAEWARYGRHTLLEEATKQILPDGVGAEQSPTYTAFSVELLALCGDLGRRLGEPFPTTYWSRLAAAAKFLRDIVDVGGHHPRIGDDDEGRVIFCDFQEEAYVPSVLTTLASLLGRSDLAPPSAGWPNLRTALFGGAVAATPPTMGLRHYADGGYTVARQHNRRGRELLLVVDHGPLGYLSIAAHGHADSLALWLHVDGLPVLIDAGTYLYHSGGRWRDHLRGTPAHNTLSIAGADSSIISGMFNWSRKARVTVDAFGASEEGWWLVAAHDGFAARFGRQHQRRVVQRATDGAITVTDRLVGRGPSLPVEIGFLLAPDLEVEETTESATARWTLRRTGGRTGNGAGGDNGVILTVRHEGPLFGRVQRGEVNPPRGWHSAGFGHLAPTYRLAFAGALGPTDEAHFVLEP